MYWQLDSRARGNMLPSIIRLGNLHWSTASGQTVRGFHKNIRAEASRRCTISHQGRLRGVQSTRALGDWRSLTVEGFSHLSAEATNLAMGGNPQA
jgi:hypothetical protein